MRRALFALGIGMWALLPAGGATAGGWWTHMGLERSHVAAGDRVRTETEVMFASIEAAEVARRSGSFYAYLVRDLDWDIVERAMGEAEPGDWWRVGDATAIRLSEVRLTGWDANVARASARFMVPEVPPGEYAVMFCTDGCRGAMADVVPSRIRVVADPATAELSRVVSRLDLRVYNLGQRVQRLRGEAARVQGLEQELQRVRPELDRVRAVVGSADRNAGQEVPWVAFAGWFVAGAASVTLLWFGRRRRSVVPIVERVPDDARELTGRGA